MPTDLKRLYRRLAKLPGGGPKLTAFKLLAGHVRFGCCEFRAVFNWYVRESEKKSYGCFPTRAALERAMAEAGFVLHGEFGVEGDTPYWHTKGTT